VVDLSKEILTLRENVEKNLLKSTPQKQLNDKVAELSKYIADNKDFERHVGEAVQKTFTENERNILKSVQGSTGVFTGLAQAAEKGAEGAAKKGGGFFGFFKHSEESLADLASRVGREGRGTRLWAPLVTWSKARIVREALRLGVPIERTWSCYTGGSEPCGRCDSCRIRDAALIEAGRPDLASCRP
jgi:alkanesulfonate monooxygenase SsuD/methylene tetrahydromethanopterin reductase-like flavin-dependent oxidoreductase (luciferase family)